MATKETQFTVLMKNEPGQLAHIASMITESGVNVRALSAYTNGEFGVVRIVVNNVKLVRAMLKNTDHSFFETPVISHEVPNRPGELARVAKLLAKEKVNVDNIYCSTGAEDAVTNMVMAVSSIEGALGVLNKQS